MDDPGRSGLQLHVQIRQSRPRGMTRLRLLPSYGALIRRLINACAAIETRLMAMTQATVKAPASHLGWTGSTAYPSRNTRNTTAASAAIRLVHRPCLSRTCQVYPGSRVDVNVRACRWRDPVAGSSQRLPQVELVPFRVRHRASSCIRTRLGQPPGWRRVRRDERSRPRGLAQ